VIRTLIVSDRPLVVDGLRAVLEADKDFEVIGTAATTGAAKATVQSQTPDVAVVDSRIDGEKGDDLVGELRHLSPLTECVVLSVSNDAGTFREALSHGAHGYLLDGASRDDIRLAARRVAAGRSHIDPGVSGFLMHSSRAGSHSSDFGLTVRELDVLRLAAQGMTNAAIADRLKIKSETVKTHLSRAFERLGARDRAHAVAICMRRGLF
jgi:DNA-binding NarL/FixJ family response regulator